MANAGRPDESKPKKTQLECPYRYHGPPRLLFNLTTHTDHVTLGRKPRGRSPLKRLMMGRTTEESALSPPSPARARALFYTATERRCTPLGVAPPPEQSRHRPYVHDDEADCTRRPRSFQGAPPPNHAHDGWLDGLQAHNIGGALGFGLKLRTSWPPTTCCDLWNSTETERPRRGDAAWHDPRRPKRTSDTRCVTMWMRPMLGRDVVRKTSHKPRPAEPHAPKYRYVLKTRPNSHPSQAAVRSKSHLRQTAYQNKGRTTPTTRRTTRLSSPKRAFISAQTLLRARPCTAQASAAAHKEALQLRVAINNTEPKTCRHPQAATRAQDQIWASNPIADVCACMPGVRHTGRMQTDRVERRRQTDLRRWA